ncbi:MAG: DUF1015 domain-containing protein, partial [Phycisphaerae bacterium]|nr:DUF1015 domain-containing protein [Phycisphaerae bacterium]
MASIRPFRGLRYNTRSPLDLALVTAPPYDCITTEQQNDLYRVHPHNIVRLILNRTTSSDSAGDNRYSRAAQLLRLWREGGILSQDEKPAVYIIEHEFDVEGKRYRREGFIARVGLEEPESRIVLPHEETFTGPKEDRLKLLRATDCNLSAVMSLFDDPAGAVMAALKQGLPHAPDMQTVDGEGVVNRLWVQADPEVISVAQKLFASHSLYIADGHHRYETAAAYMKLLRESGREVGPEHPAASIMTFCIPMNDPGLVIQPTHRVIETLGGKFDLDRFRSLSS